MALVAGVDFGTQSVRVSLFDQAGGRVGAAVAGYPVLRRADDPHHATQRPADHDAALVAAMREALAAAGVPGERVAALAVATTGSTIVPVDAALRPLDDFILWCDHRAVAEAEEITRAARAEDLEALRWYGGVYPAEMAWAKVLHWLRRNPGKRSAFATAVEHCDYMVARLTGVTRAADLVRGVCAAGHKWLWLESAGGLPPDEFFNRVDPLLAGASRLFPGRFLRSDAVAGRLGPEWAERLGLRAGIPVPAASLDAHWDAIGAGIAEGDVVNVVGTSTCVMAIMREARAIPGVFGVVPGSVHPGLVGVEAGLSAAGDIFEAIARRAGQTVAQLAAGLENYRAGQTGLLRLVWDNGDRNVLADPGLSGATLGWRLGHTARDELFAAIEGTACHTRLILERLREHGVPVRRVINAGGIPRRSAALNQVYANLFNLPVLVPEADGTGLGSAIFALVAAGAFPTVEAAQRALCPGYREVRPDPAAAGACARLFAAYREVYFGWGRGEPMRPVRDVLAGLVPA